jgi:hypothetical protein
MALVSTLPLTEMSTRNLPGGKGLPARKSDNLTAMSQLFTSCGRLDVSQSYGPPRLVSAIALRFLPSFEVLVTFGQKPRSLFCLFVCIYCNIDKE